MLKRPRLDTLGLRLGVIFLGGAVALQLAMWLVVLWPGGPGRPVFLLPAPADAAAMAEALERAPPALQPTILRALDNDSLSVHLASDFRFEDAGEEGPEARRLERLFARYGRALDGRAYQIQTRGGTVVALGYGGEIVGAHPVRMVVRLRTGPALVIERRMPTAVRRFRARAAMVGASGLGVLGLVLLLAWRQTAGPVLALARGARGFAADMARPDLPVRGAREVRDLSAALNQMKATIRALMDERTRMLAAIAHDLRTYLTRLRLRAEFINDPEQRERAVADLDEMSLLLEDTLTFAREATRDTAGPRACIDVAELIATLAETRTEMGQSVQVAPLATPLIACCAPLALRRMLDNLVDNALRYAGAARLSAGVASGEVWLAVEDDGPGVPASELERITAPFARLEGSRGRNTGGAGLGLSIVRALAESQGGRLTIANRAEGGLAVTVRLPTPSAHGPGD